jgi:DNA primase
MLFFWESELKQSLREGENLIRSPLREDENPSFSLNTRNGLWNDFATNQKGNIFTFIMLKYNLTFPESIKYLKNKFINQCII